MDDDRADILSGQEPLVSCQECGVELAADSPELRIDLTCDHEPIVYCAGCWHREFGGSAD